MQKYISRIEYYFTLVSVVFLIGNPLEVLIFGNASEQFSASSNSLEPAIKVSIYAISFCFLVIHWKKTLYQLLVKHKRIWLILMLVAIALASSLWSLFPEITLRRGVLCLGATIFGIHLGTRYDLNQQIKFLALGFSTAMLMSLFFGIALPHYGIMRNIHAGAWCGIFSHKNGLGYVAASSSILFLILLLGEGKKNWKTWLIFLISFILLILARSATSLLAFCAVVVSLFLYRAFRLRYDRMVPVLIFLLFLVASIGIFLIGERESFANMLGKDLTLTGRTIMWPLVWDSIHKQPWFGYGYEGFWWPQNSEAFRIWLVTGWRPTHPHNGFLKILTDIGWVGGILFSLAFGLTFLKSLVLLRATKEVFYYWPIAFLSFFFFINMAESNFMDGGFAWIILTAICIA